MAILGGIALFGVGVGVGMLTVIIVAGKAMEAWADVFRL